MTPVIRDLVHAARSLAKDRGFTLVCVISLGIGMAALVALATFTRAITAPARAINTDGLTELLVLPLGPLREKAGEWALEQWSYPDYQALRETDTGMAITAWALGTSPHVTSFYFPRFAGDPRYGPDPSEDQFIPLHRTFHNSSSRAARPTMSA